jgi:hypothetical protein
MDPSESSEVMRPGAQSPEIRIFAGKFSDISSAAVFSPTLSFNRPPWRFHRLPVASLAGNPNIRAHNRFSSSETDAVRALENC